MDLPEPLLVFAQTTSLALDVEAWSAHAERFFATKLGRMNEPDVLLVAENGSAPIEIRVQGAARSEEDLLEAERAELADPVRSSGLSLLARRCGAVFHVARIANDEAGAHAELLVAAILASVLLGPIVDRQTAAIYGVRGARTRLTPPS